MSIGITLTGADERTPGDELDKLADQGAEIGLLYTHSPDGRNRYPALGWLIGMAMRLEGAAAIHVCGWRARQQLMEGKVDALFKRVKRIQINGVIETAQLKMLCERWFPKTIITQHSRQMNRGLSWPEIPNHAILCDGSGGRGLLPNEWVRPETSKPVGFAGGLGPDNLRDQLNHIAKAATGQWWIDMEAKLRDEDDWFSVEKAKECLAIFDDWNNF